jgi:VWFA-related protein
MRTRILLVLVVALAYWPALGADEKKADAAKYKIEILDQPDVTDLQNIKLRFRIVDENGNTPADLPDETLTIYEDGKPVHWFQPVELHREPMAAVLAIDTSGSMQRLEKIDKAKQAADHFFEKLDPKTPCGLVLFHHQPYQIRPLGLDKKELRALVADAKPRGGTAYFDATHEAIQLLAADKEKRQRAIVLMTDGRDVNSTRTLQEVITEAKANKVAVYTLGLGNPGSDEAVRTIMVLDRSGSMRESNKFVCLKRAASRYVELLPPEAADMSIIAFDHHIPRLDPDPPSRDKEVLLRKIDRLTIGGGTALYDALYEAVETLNASSHRPAGRPSVRRVVVCLTDGLDTDSHRYRETDVIRLAKESRIKIYMLGLGQEKELNEPVMRKIAGETGGEYFHVLQPDALTDIFEDLSTSIHDDGIDVNSLQRLAAETGGKYYHVQNAEDLTVNFEAVAKYMQDSYPVKFASRRSVHDGTARGIEIKFGNIAVSRAAYRTHGFITPRSNHVLYLALLAGLLLLLGFPGWLRRLAKGPTAAA